MRSADADRRQPVRDHERRASAHEVLERALDERLGLGVERGRRLVEQQHPRVAHERARDREPLALAARQARAALADDGVPALGLRVDDLERVRVAQGGEHALVVGTSPRP